MGKFHKVHATIGMEIRMALKIRTGMVQTTQRVAIEMIKDTALNGFENKRGNFK